MDIALLLLLLGAADLDIFFLSAVVILMRARDSGFTG